MTNVKFDDAISHYDFEELNGKTLKILANNNANRVLVLGLCVETSVLYTLINNPKEVTK